MYRSMYHNTMIEYNDILAQYSLHRANRISQYNEFVQHFPIPYGENIYITPNYDICPDICVDNWMSAQYSWIEDENNWDNGLESFSQCIWEDTFNIGMAKSILPDGRLLIICNYFPKGNNIGERPYRV